MTNTIPFKIIDIFSWIILYTAELLVCVLGVFEVDMATKNLKKLQFSKYFPILTELIESGKQTDTFCELQRVNSVWN